MKTSDRLRLKTRVFTIVVVLSNALGNFALATGMRNRATASALDYLAAIFSPWVGTGIVLLIVWLLSRMALLSWADLSYVLPVTSLGYVANALGGHAADRRRNRAGRPGRAAEPAAMRTWFLLAAMVFSTVLGDLLQSVEMKRHGEIKEFHPRRLARVLAALARKKFLILAVALMAVSFFAFMTLLETADLSFAVPASAATLVFETILAKVVLKEEVDSRRWAGACLVAFGVVLLAR